MEPVLRKIGPDGTRGLPSFLISGSRFHEWKWLNHPVVLVERGEMAPDISPADAKAQADVLLVHFRRPIAFVFDALKPHQRQRLVQLGVPFVVPGLQLFIPPFVSLTEQFQRMAKVDKLSAAAQLTLLYQLLRRPSSDAPLIQWAKWLNYSAMTMTKVRDDLVAANLCEREPGAKPRGLRFLHERRALWNAALPYLRSPVKITSWAKLPDRFPGLNLAGLSALSRQSMIEDDVLPTYACRTSDWKKSQHSKKAVTAEHADEANTRVELWRYDPDVLAGDGIVDPLSLFLSFSDTNDERVRAAADALLEVVPW
jgi:DNA-binding MarR family transcriptional regulator